MSFNYLGHFVILYGVQAQFARVVLHIFSNSGPQKYVEWFLKALCQDQKAILDLVPNEDFITRFVVYTHPLLNHRSTSIVDRVWQLWTSIFKFKKSLQQRIFGHSFSKPHEARKLSVNKQITQEVAKSSEKELQEQREWLNSRNSIKQSKAQLYSKVQERTRHSTQFVNLSSSTMLTQQSKAFHDQVQQTMEKQKTMRREWKTLLKRISHERGICDINNRTGLLKVDRIEGTNRMSPRLKYVTHQIPFLSTTIQNQSAVSQRNENDEEHYLSP